MEIYYYYIFSVYHFGSFFQLVCTSSMISSDHNSIDLPCTINTIADITLFSQEIQAVSAMKILHGEKPMSQAVTVDHSWS